MNAPLMFLLVNTLVCVSMEEELLSIVDSKPAEVFSINSTLLADLVRSNIKNELRKLKSSVTDSVMEELLNYYGKKFEKVDFLNGNFDLMSKKVALMAKNLNILAQNYRIISKNHRNLVNIVRNNMLAKKELNQVKMNSLKKKSIDASKPNREKLKSEFVQDLENKYSVLFEGGILQVLKNLNKDTPKTASHSPLVQLTHSSKSPNQLIIENVPTDCQDLVNENKESNKVYNITLLNKNVTFSVHCEFEDGIGWTVIQERHDGSVSFFRDWNSYKTGFGNLDKLGEFWLGLEKIYQLTNQNNYSLQIVMSDWQNEVYVAEYSTFRIDDEKHKYKLELGSFLKNSSTVADSLIENFYGQGHNNMAFSTYDSDNDMRFYDNCAQIYRSGWWFNACFQSNLNGIYYSYADKSKNDGSKHTRSNALFNDQHSRLRFLRNGIHWNAIDLNMSLKSTKMRLKRI